MKLREPMTWKKGATLVAMVVALALAAVRCSVNVPLGVDPKSDAAELHADASAGD